MHEQRCRNGFKTTLKKQPYECHLPPTLLVHSQPQFATHLPLPLRYNGSSPEGPSVRANNRKYTKVGIQTSTLFYSTVLFCPIVCLTVKFLHIYYTWRTNRSWLPYSGLCRPTALWHEYVCICVCVRACICVSLIGIVSISKRPDSYPQSLYETKRGRLMMPSMSLDRLSMFMGDILPV